MSALTTIATSLSKALDASEKSTVLSLCKKTANSKTNTIEFEKMFSPTDLLTLSKPFVRRSFSTYYKIKATIASITRSFNMSKRTAEIASSFFKIFYAPNFLQNTVLVATFASCVKEAAIAEIAKKVIFKPAATQDDIPEEQEDTFFKKNEAAVTSLYNLYMQIAEGFDTACTNIKTKNKNCSDLAIARFVRARLMDGNFYSAAAITQELPLIAPAEVVTVE